MNLKASRPLGNEEWSKNNYGPRGIMTTGISKQNSLIGTTNLRRFIQSSLQTLKIKIKFLTFLC